MSRGLDIVMTINQDTMEVFYDGMHLIRHAVGLGYFVNFWWCGLEFVSYLLYTMAYLKQW